MAVQDQVMGKNCFENNILKEETDNKFCWCNERGEIINHLNCNGEFKEKSESTSKKTFNTFPTNKAKLGNSHVIQKLM